MRSVLPSILFPLTLTVALVAAYWLNQGRGLAPETAAILVTVGAGAWVWLWEFLLPYRQHWNRNDDDLGTDILHFLVIGALSRIIKPLYLLLLFPVVGFLNTHVGADNLWPHDWPLLLQLALVLVLCEFGRYWFHRFSHQVPLLWNFHAVHHSPNRLYWLNAARFHPVERFYLQVPELLPFILLGPSDTVLMLYLVVNSVHGFFQHSNIQTRIGWLNYVFSMTELHRWHHSKVIAPSDRNFGNILILWDLVFGTYYLPRDREVGSLGLMNPQYPKGYFGQLVAPFQHQRDKPDDYNERKDFYHQQALSDSDSAAR